MEAIRKLIDRAGLTRGLPQAPSAQLAPYLDAAVRCVERYGWSRTGAKDIAREAGVERTTIYRHLGSRDQILRLLVAREVHRLIDSAIETSRGAERGPQVVIEFVAASVEYIWRHPAISKLIRHDPELLSGFLIDGLSETIERFAEALAPMLGAAMDAGEIARRDPVVVTHWVVRVGVSLLVAPPPTDLRTFLSAVMEPVLQPEKDA